MEGISHSDTAAFGGGENLWTRKTALFGMLRRYCPAERRAEWSLDPAGRLFATLCLRGVMPAKAFGDLASQAGLSSPQLEEALGFRALGCWRHIVRCDDRGGLALYAERDWDPALLRALAAGHDIRLAEIASAVTRCGAFVVAIAGIHWGHAVRRLRLHLVAQRERWTAATAQVREVVEAAIGPSDPLDILLEQPRRALVWNLECVGGQLTCKVEVPDLPLRRVAGVLRGTTESFPLQALPPGTPSRLSYLGVRFRSEQAPAATLYFREPREVS